MHPTRKETTPPSKLQKNNIFINMLHRILNSLLRISIAKEERRSVLDFFQTWNTIQYVGEESQPTEKTKKLFIVASFSNREKFVIDIFTKSQNPSELITSIWKWIFLHQPVFMGKEVWESHIGDVIFLYDGVYGHTSVERNCEKMNKRIRDIGYEEISLIHMKNLSFRCPIWSTGYKNVPVRIQGKSIEKGTIFSSDIGLLREEMLPSRSKTSSHKPRKRISFTQTCELEHFLWMCPNCFSTKTLKGRNRQEPELHCKKCNSSWWVDIGWIMYSLTPIIDQSLREIYIYEAIEIVLRHIGRRPIQNKNQYTQSLTICLENTAQIFLDTVGREMIAVGELYLQSNLLYVQSRSGRLWELELSNIEYTRIWDADEIILQSKDYRYCIRLISGNAFMWQYYIECWMSLEGEVI
jgi:hypothetical protein